MNLELPELALVVLVGVSGSGKSSFVRRHFKPTEVLSSDICRGLVSDDENNQAATNDAFDVLQYIAAKRLARGLLTVVDATNLRPEDRRQYVQLAREHHCLPVAIVLDLPESICHERNKARPDRSFGPHVIRNQRSAMRRGLGRRGANLRREGFRQVWLLDSEEETDACTIARVPLWNNRKNELGPFDIIGDVHGCFEELTELLERLGYEIDRDPTRPRGDWDITAPIEPDGRPRRAIFLGDLVDRGPDSPAVLRLVMRMVEQSKAMCVPGNHDIKLMRKLDGRNVQLTHGLAETVAQLEREPTEFHERVRSFIDGLVSHFLLDGGNLVVAHAGLKESMHGRGSGAVREFCLYGETTGETDEFGLPVRYNWASEYRGRATVVYGHTPVPEPDWLNNTLCIDTGCVFGGRLTALRYPEREIVSVPAQATYAEARRPFLPEHEPAKGVSAQHAHDDMLDLGDVLGKRIIDTRLQRNVTVREDNATAALEVMSRFAVDHRWLIYLPPTMSPSETSILPSYLEHPAEAFSYYRDHGVGEVICEEKHMGSRAVVIVCRDAAAARERFGVDTDEIGICYTRTGRRFFNDESIESLFLERVRDAATGAGLWGSLNTVWLCLDCELMPWSAKAQALLREQYAAVASAGVPALTASCHALERTLQRIPETGPEGTVRPGQALITRYHDKLGAMHRYREAYRGYCWPVDSLDDMRLAPFHLLASEGAVHTDKDHLWHMATLASLAERDHMLIGTRHWCVNLTDEAGTSDAAAWWEQMTSDGGEGMVVKPREFVARGTHGLLQPAIKCRGPEYLRIIYGPEYQQPANLERLRMRGLKHKRALALREFALGIEGLERFARREPLRRVHECVFGVLALESEPVDPRL